jgi:sugar transferase (PEP-CTERM/EpsH1 system associated)
VGEERPPLSGCVRERARICARRAIGAGLALNARDRLAEAKLPLKILFVSHRFPYPPDSGSKIRAFNMIRHLHSAHDVTVASMARSEGEAEAGRGLAAYCTRYEMARVRTPLQIVRMVASLRGSSTASSAYFHSPDLAGAIRTLLARDPADLIIVHSSSVAHYVAHVKGTIKLLDFCDMDSQKWLAYSNFKPFPLNLCYRLEGAKLEAEERRLAGAFDVCTVATQGELKTLAGYGTRVCADWFPNGVDINYFSPSAEPYDPDVISFVGRMDYYPNQRCVLDFCRQTLPRIRQRRPEAKFLIVGADPGAAIRRLARSPGITVTGSVPDVRPYLLRSAAMVAPLEIARGTQNKILEAMSAGVPVVTSSVAAGGVDAIPGCHFLVADSPSEVAAATLELMENPRRREEFAQAGRARVLSHHTWDRAMRQLDGIIERCMANSANRCGMPASAPALDARPSAESAQPVSAAAASGTRRAVPHP